MTAAGHQMLTLVVVILTALSVSTVPLVSARVSIPSSVNVVSTWVGPNPPTSAASFADGYGSVARFNSPYGVVVLETQEVVVVDCTNNALRLVATNGFVSTLAGGTNGFANGLGTSARFDLPVGIAVYPDGGIVVPDNKNNRIRNVTPGGLVTTIAGAASPGYADGVSTAARFNSPAGIAFSPGFNAMVVVDYGNHAVRRVSPLGAVTTLAGAFPSAASGFANGASTSARFKLPWDIAVDPTTNIMYLADTANNAIRTIDRFGNVGTLAGTTSSGYTDGTGSNAQFNSPIGIAFHSARQQVLVADTSNNRIRAISLFGVVTTIAGLSTAGGFVDGAATTSAQLKSPSRLTVRPNGDIVFADRDNGAIRVLGPQKTSSRFTNTSSPSGTVSQETMNSQSHSQELPTVSASHSRDVASLSLSHSAPTRTKTRRAARRSQTRLRTQTISNVASSSASADTPSRSADRAGDSSSSVSSPLTTGSATVGWLSPTTSATATCAHSRTVVSDSATLSVQQATPTGSNSPHTATRSHSQVRCLSRELASSVAMHAVSPRVTETLPHTSVTNQTDNATTATFVLLEPSQELTTKTEGGKPIMRSWVTVPVAAAALVVNNVSDAVFVLNLTATATTEAATTTTQPSVVGGGDAEARRVAAILLSSIINVSATSSHDSTQFPVSVTNALVPEQSSALSLFVVSLPRVSAEIANASSWASPLSSSSSSSSLTLTFRFASCNESGNEAGVLSLRVTISVAHASKGSTNRMKGVAEGVGVVASSVSVFGSVTASTSVARLTATRQLLTCTTNDGISGGILEVSVDREYDGVESNRGVARGAVVGNIGLLIGGAMLLIAAAGTILVSKTSKMKELGAAPSVPASHTNEEAPGAEGNRNTTRTNFSGPSFVDVLLRLACPSTLLPLFAAGLPSTASAITFLTLDGGLDAADIALWIVAAGVFTAAILALLTAATVRAEAWFGICGRPRSSKGNSDHQRRGGVFVFVSLARRAFRWLNERSWEWKPQRLPTTAADTSLSPPEAIDSALLAKDEPENSAAVRWQPPPLRRPYERIIWTVLLEYRVPWFLALDAGCIVVISALAMAVSVRGQSASCRGALIVVLLIFAAELVLCLVVKPYTTWSSHALTVMTLWCSALSALFMLLAHVDGTSPESRLFTAAAAFDIVVSILALVKLVFVDLPQYAFAAWRVVQYVRRTTHTRRRRTMTSSGRGGVGGLSMLCENDIVSATTLQLPVAPLEVTVEEFSANSSTSSSCSGEDEEMQPTADEVPETTRGASVNPSTLSDAAYNFDGTSEFWTQEGHAIAQDVASFSILAGGGAQADLLPKRYFDVL